MGGIRTRAKVATTSQLSDGVALDNFVANFSTIWRSDAGMVDKIKAIWATVSQVVEELIEAAEVMYGPKTGSEKKAFVRGKILELMKEIQGKHNILPVAVESMVFKALEFALDNIIERVFRELNKRGAVNFSA
jgi:hypothetical protein